MGKSFENPLAFCEFSADFQSDNGFSLTNYRRFKMSVAKTMSSLLALATIRVFNLHCRPRLIHLNITFYATDGLR